MSSSQENTALSDAPSVAVVGMGYVGLTLASLLATRGFRVHGVEENPRVVRSLDRKEVHLLEPGVETAIEKHLGSNWTVSEAYAFSPEVAVICVSTPVNDQAVPELKNLKHASAALAEIIKPGALVIVRSTVPIGTTRKIVLPLLANKKVRLAFCPERTIQGRALRELVELPQVIGGLDVESRQAAEQFFGRFAGRLMPVSSLEAAEMVKLANNCHTDVIYSYGNEVALMAKEFGLDPLEVIDGANINYPRPDLAKPGFVGGACLTKDPYILFASFDSARCSPGVIRSARILNEKMPREIASHLLDLLKRTGRDLRGLNVLICGFAYKGIPETDDMRGSPIAPFLETVRNEGLKLTGHDPIVRSEVIASYGVQPVSLEKGFSDADAVIFLNNHPNYASLDLASMIKSSPRLLVLYDCWRIFRSHPALTGSNIRYAGIGYERP